MADHYKKTLELLDEISGLETDLASAYRAGRPANQIADLHQRLGRTLKKASIHAQLAAYQAHYDVPVSS